MAGIVPTILAANPEEEDIILLGDFNADGDYLDESDLPTIFPANAFQVLITDDMDTMTTSDNTYDRIIVPVGNAEYIEGTAQVFEFDFEYGLTGDDFIKKISDHYPVFAEFRTTGPDDDGGP